MVFGWLKRLDDWLKGPRDTIEQSSIGHFILIGVGVFTVGQLIVDLWDRGAEREDRRLGQIERSWTHLLTRTPGNTGKGNSLTFLMGSGETIRAIDLSCEAIGVWNEGCNGRPVFSGADFRVLPVDALGFATFDPKFDDVIFENTNFGPLALDAGFERVEIKHSNLRKNLMSANFEIIYESDLSEIGCECRRDGKDRNEQCERHTHQSDRLAARQAH